MKIVIITYTNFNQNVFLVIKQTGRLCACFFIMEVLETILVFLVFLVLPTKSQLYLNPKDDPNDYNNCKLVRFTLGLSVIAQLLFEKGNF